MGNTQKKSKQINVRFNNGITKPVQGLQKPQEQGHGIIVIEAPVSETQTLVKLCRNNDSWLSPTGWTNIEKSTLLDSENNGIDKSTRFIIPANFARELQNGDQLVLDVLHLGLKSELTWFSTSSNSEIATDLTLSESKVESPKSTDHGDDTSKPTLLHRFRAKPKNKENTLSDIEQLAQEARRNADALTKEMQLAQKTKKAAETRALEAARLAEIANLQELERAQQVAAAQQTLKDAEAARTQEQERIKAAQLAEVERKKQETIEAELQRHKARLKELSAVKQTRIHALTLAIDESNQGLKSQKTHFQELQLDAKKHTTQLQSDAEVQSLAQDHVIKAKANLVSAQSVFETSQRQDETINQIRNQSRDQINNKTKQLKKMDGDIHKSQRLYEDAQTLADTAIAKAQILQDKFIEAKGLHNSLKTNIMLAQEQHASNEQKYMTAQNVLQQSETELSRAQGTLKTLQDDHDATAHTHAHTTSTYHNTMNKINQAQTHIKSSEQHTQSLQKQLEGIQDLKITMETLNDAHQTLERTPPLKHSTPTSKAVPLANTALNEVLIQNSDVSQEDYTAEVLANKPQPLAKHAQKIRNRLKQAHSKIAKKATPAIIQPTVYNVAEPTPTVVTPDGTENILANLAQANTQNRFGMNLSGLNISKQKALTLTALLLVSAATVSWLIFQPEKPKITQTLPVQKTVLPAPTVNNAPQKTDSKIEITKQPSTEKLEAPTPSKATTATPPAVQTKPAAIIKPAPEKPSLKPTVKKASPATKQSIKQEVTPAVKKSTNVNVEIKKAPIVTLATPKTPTVDPQISSIQGKLQKLGFYNGEVTGVLDTATTSSLYAFQSLFDLEQTSTFTPALFSALASASTVTPTPDTLQKTPPPVEVSVENTPAQIAITPPTTDANTDINPVPSTEGNIGLVSESKAELAQENATVVADNIIAARKLFTPSLQYPSRVLERKILKTTVVVNITYDINANGKVENSAIKDITGTTRFERDFSRSALKLVKKMRFSPKTINGEAVASPNRSINIKYPPQN